MSSHCLSAWPEEMMNVAVIDMNMSNTQVLQTNSQMDESQLEVEKKWCELDLIAKYLSRIVVVLITVH